MSEYGPASTELPARSRGVIALVPELCTSCMICARECPDWCIYIDSHSIDSHGDTLPPTHPETSRPAPTSRGRERTRAVLDRFAIDFGLCMYCGICVEVCPFDALHWSAEHIYPGSELRDLLHEQDRLASWLSSVPPPPALDPGAGPGADATGRHRR